MPINYNQTAYRLGDANTPFSIWKPTKSTNASGQPSTYELLGKRFFAIELTRSVEKNIDQGVYADDQYVMIAQGYIAIDNSCVLEDMSVQRPGEVLNRRYLDVLSVNTTDGVPAARSPYIRLMTSTRQSMEPVKFDIQITDIQDAFNPIPHDKETSNLVINVGDSNL